MPRTSRLGEIRRWSADHRRVVALFWLAVFLGAIFGNCALGGLYSDNFTLPSNPAQIGANLLTAHLPSAGGQTGQIVFSVTFGTIAEHRSAIETSTSS